MRKFEIGDIVKCSNKRIRITDINEYNDYILNDFSHYEPITVDIDWFSSVGFIVSIIDGISTYLIRYEDLMLTPVFDTDTKEIVGFAVLSGTHYDTNTKSVVMDVVHFIKPIKYIHEVQHLLRLAEYYDFEETLN